MHPHTRLRYRPEIDGLRALSLAGVLLFHSQLGILPGGYVGVDVFFVISGYLITSIIARDLDSNTFSFLSFYERRARRILPALTVVLAACYLPALVLLMPGELVEFAKSACAIMLSVSNVWFLLISGYFGPVAERQPLLHTWSLSVEEQFYAMFRLVMAILWRWGRRPVLATLFVMTLISLAPCEWWMGSGGRPEAAFFLPPFRIWEFLIGSLVAMLPAAALNRAWEQWAAERLSGTLERIPLRPDQRLFVVGTKCFEPPRPLSYTQVPPSERHAMQAKVNEYRRQVNETPEGGRSARCVFESASDHLRCQRRRDPVHRRWQGSLVRWVASHTGEGTMDRSAHARLDPSERAHEEIAVA